MATTLTEGVQIVNESLRNLGYEYQIDTTSNDTMTEGLEKIGAYPPEQLNAIMGQMNLIIQARNYYVMFNAEKNPFRQFLVDMSENGFGIEDLFHEIMEGTEALWDKKGNEDDILHDLVSYDDTKIHKAFHVASASKEFKVTIDVRNYKKVFTAIALPRYIDTKLANMQASAEIWLQKVGIDIVKEMISKGDIIFSTGYDINTGDGVRNMVESIKSTVGGFLTPCNQFNKGVYDPESQSYRSLLQMTNSKNDIFIITTPENMERLKVQGYANAYNLSQFELDGRIMYVPAGTELGEYGGEKVLFVAIDRRALVIGLKYWLGSSKFIENVHRVNHFLLVEILKGYNTYFNAVAFTGASVDDFFMSKKGATLFLSYSAQPTGITDVNYVEVDGVRYTGQLVSGWNTIGGANSPGGTKQYAHTVRDYVEVNFIDNANGVEGANHVYINGEKMVSAYGSGDEFTTRIDITDGINTIYIGHKE